MSWLKEAHVGSWELALVLAVVSYALYLTGKTKVGFILHNIVRVCYIIIVGTGLTMLIQWDVNPIFHLKALLAVIGIGLLEMSLVRAKKEKPSAVFLASGLVVLVVVILIGYGVIGGF